MSERIIVEIQEDIPSSKALDLVSRVVARGKISESRGIPQYCFLTDFCLHKIQVITRSNRKGQESSSFIVRKYK